MTFCLISRKKIGPLEKVLRWILRDLGSQDLSKIIFTKNAYMYALGHNRNLNATSLPLDHVLYAKVPGILISCSDPTNRYSGSQEILRENRCSSPAYLQLHSLT